MNDDRPTGKCTTVTILRSWSAATAGGATALMIQTPEVGTIAIVVPRETIPLLRKELADIEALHALGTGNS